MIGVPVRLATCMITSSSPLMVDLGDGVPIAAIAIDGLNYATGSALALVREAGNPIIFRIGV